MSKYVRVYDKKNQLIKGLYPFNTQPSTNDYRNLNNKPKINFIELFDEVVLDFVVDGDKTNWLGIETITDKTNPKMYKQIQRLSFNNIFGFITKNDLQDLKPRQYGDLDIFTKGYSVGDEIEIDMTGWTPKLPSEGCLIYMPSAQTKQKKVFQAIVIDNSKGLKLLKCVITAYNDIQ